ncbi:MAG: septum formation initiator family protein [Solirubrobacteraceae bacterium]
MLVALAYLYISPIRGLLGDLHQAAARHQQVVALEREAAQLRGEQRALSEPSTLEREARRLGLVRPGEREYVVTGLPNN